MFDTLSDGQWQILAALLLATFVGKSLGAETRVLTSLLIVAILAPGAFPLMAVGVVLIAAIVKVGSQWVTWL